MQTPISTRRYTPAEYLELEEQAEAKSEYRNGEIIPMTGGTTNHHEISLNLASILKFALKRQNYKVYMGAVKLWIPRYEMYTYPDVMVIQGQPLYEGKSTTTVTNPLLLAEVLSSSTRTYDQTDKFTFYRSIPSFQEYVLIDQSQFQVMHFSKQEDNKWLMAEYQEESAVLPLASLPFEIVLADLYEGVNFAEAEQA